MYAWEKVFREQVAPKLSTLELEKLYEGLLNNDPDLVQNSCFKFGDDCCTPVGGCGVLYGMVKANPVANSNDLRNRFWVIRNADTSVLGTPIGNPFIQWFDSTPRGTMRVNLSVVVLDEISKRPTEPSKAHPGAKSTHV